MLGLYFFSYSYSVRRGGRYSYSKRFSMAILAIGLQVPANRADQRSESPQSKQPSSTSTASLSTSTASLSTSTASSSTSTASLSTSTAKSEAMHER